MRYVRGFGRVSTQEARGADIFFAELTGGPVRRPVGARSWSADGLEAFEALDEQATPPVAQRPFLPTGGVAFVPRAGTFNCSPTPFTVVPASFLPAPTTDSTAAIDAALTAAGLDATQRGRVTRAGLEPIAAAFGASALTELLARLRWSAADIARWGAGASSKLVPRLLIHVPGHFRELARRASAANEAFVLECLGWLVMVSLRDAVAAATRTRWWIPPAPAFVTAVPNPIPSVDDEIARLILRYGFIDTMMTPGEWNGRYRGWCNGLPGRQWEAERNAPQPGLPFYASLATIPPYINTTALRAGFTTGWNQRVADTDAVHAPHVAGAATVTLSGLQNAEALRRCDNANPHLPAGGISSLDLQGLELAYEFPIAQGRPTIRRLDLMTALHPVFTALFRAIKELGWNDLMYQTSGAGCFRGIKHPAAARVSVGGRSVTVDPFTRPDATTVTRINNDFTPAERARVLAAARTARRMSEHGLGAAIDVDVPENDQGSATRPFGSMDPRLVAVFEAFHFRWGACFNPTDPHHFEYCPAACAPAVVPTPTGAPGGGMIPTGSGPAIA